MNKIRLFLAAITAVFALAAVAQIPPRDQDRRDQDKTFRDHGRPYHDQDRVTTDGKIRSLKHERDGYRVELDRGDDRFWVPESVVRGHIDDFRVGASIHFGGIFRGGVIYVDAVDWPEIGRYGDRYERVSLHGIVESINDRRGTLTLREEGTRRRITVDMGRIERRQGPFAPFGPFAGPEKVIRLDDLHRGDYLELTGDWLDGGVFAARRIDAVRYNRH